MNATNTKSGHQMEQIAKRLQSLAKSMNANQEAKDIAVLLERFSEVLDGELNTLQTQLRDLTAQVRELSEPKP